MNTAKYLFIPILATSLLVLAGCTAQTSTNTNTANDNTNTSTANTNVADVENANVTVANENTNTTDVSGEVDMSDWLTYENEEYGFSFKYPQEAKLVENGNSLPYPGVSFLGDITVDNTKQEDLQGVTIAFAITDLDLNTLAQKIEQSDTSRGVTLSKVDTIQESTLNEFTIYQGSHATAIGIPTDFYYIPLKNNLALFIFYSGDKNNVNSSIINTLSVEN